jgi:hypothetical protein
MLGPGHPAGCRVVRSGAISAPLLFTASHPPLGIRQGQFGHRLGFRYMSTATALDHIPLEAYSASFYQMTVQHAG